MKKPNAAQIILLALGVADSLVFLSHLKGKNQSYTKKGPGRRKRTEGK